MRKKIFFVFVIASAIIAGVMVFLLGSKKESQPSPHDSTGFIIGKNAIYVAEQIPARTLSVAVAHLEKSGFVVVHEEGVAGVPDKILGVSALLPAGETQNGAPILLSRITRDGETVYVILHLDDGDGIFDPARDQPARDPLGTSPIIMAVTISISAEGTEPDALSL